MTTGRTNPKDTEIGDAMTQNSNKAHGASNDTPADGTETHRSNVRDFAADEATDTGDTFDAEAGDEGDVEAEIARLAAENEKLRDQALRAMAETENVRRRAERDKEDSAKYGVTRFARDLLEVADNLRRALDAVPRETVDSNDDLRTIVEGVSATEKGLLDTFERHGITRIDPQDEKFDPNFHQAMMEVPGTGKPAGTVVQVLAPGYVIHDRLLRAAMVAVAAGNDTPQRVDTSA